MTGSTKRVSDCFLVVSPRWLVVVNTKERPTWSITREDYLCVLRNSIGKT